jgi:hypothetical protein
LTSQPGDTDTYSVETSRLVSERSLEELLWMAVSARCEGLVMLRDRDGLRHGVWVQRGFIVGVHVAGRFDPLLDLLRRHGTLDAHGYRACVDALWRSKARSGALAMELAGVARPVVRDALKEQTCARLHALLEIAATRGHDACFEARPVSHTEVSVRMPLGTILRHAPQHTASERVRERSGDGANTSEPRARTGEPDTREDARRRLRALAKTLHPDKNAHLDEGARRALERDLARATAAYHGFA